MTCSQPHPPHRHREAAGRLDHPRQELERRREIGAGKKIGERAMRLVDDVCGVVCRMAGAAQRAAEPRAAVPGGTRDWMPVDPSPTGLSGGTR